MASSIITQSAVNKSNVSAAGFKGVLASCLVQIPSLLAARPVAAGAAAAAPVRVDLVCDLVSPQNVAQVQVWDYEGAPVVRFALVKPILFRPELLALHAFEVAPGSLSAPQPASRGWGAGIDLVQDENGATIAVDTQWAYYEFATATFGAGVPRWISFAILDTALNNTFDATGG